jgi:hypothetical protein
MATVDKPKSSVRFNTFGAMAYDANHQPVGISASTNYFMTIDATGTPQTSPLSVTTGTTTLVVPVAAVDVVLCGSAAFSVSEDPSMGGAFLVPANTPTMFPCITPDIDNATSGVGGIYLTTATTASVSFRFDCV